MYYKQAAVMYKRRVRWALKGIQSKHWLFRSFLRKTCQRRRVKLFYNRYQQKYHMVFDPKAKKKVRKRYELFALKIMLRKLLKWLYQSDKLRYY